ncbi:MAG: EamA family transporter [Gammaproteobacteria bacterium]|nr:EamA family transporter [Gammaproteobacteria bacterium]
MSTNLVLLVLFAAALHAGWNALAKSGGNPLYSIAAYRLVAGLISLGLLWTVPLPTAEAWVFLIASMLIHNVYYFTLGRAYLSGDLSLVYPLFRGLAPVLVAAGAAIFFGEVLSLQALLGVFLVSAGLISLAFFGISHPYRLAPTLGWSLATCILIAMYTVTDGVGVRQVENSLSYILWLFTLEAVPIVIWLTWFQRQNWVAFLAQNPAQVLAGGLASSAAYGIVIHAMGLGAMALVSSLRETSVIFAALIGALLLKEPFGRQRIFAASVVALGVMVIRYLG